MKAYSMDLRERILKAHDAGMPKFRVVQTFHVSGPTVNRYIAQRRKTGSIAPKAIPGRPRAIRPEQQPELVAQLEAAPDATLAEHRQAWERDHGTRVDISTMQRAIKRVRWTRKKKR